VLIFVWSGPVTGQNLRGGGKAAAPPPSNTRSLPLKVNGPAHEGRFLIQFSEYARVNIPDAWHGGRNPVSYGTLQDLGIDPSTLKWEPMPKATAPALVLQLLLWEMSESMGNHDSEVVDASSVD